MITINATTAQELRVPKSGHPIGAGLEGTTIGFPNNPKCVKIRPRNVDFGDGTALKSDRVVVKEYCMGRALEAENADHLICKTDNFYINSTDNTVASTMERYDCDFSQIMPAINCFPVGICAPSPLAIAANQVRENVTQHLKNLGIGVRGEDNDNKNWFIKEVNINDSSPNSFLVNNRKYKVARGDLSLSNVTDEFKEKMKNQFNQLRTQTSQVSHIGSDDMFDIF